MLIAALSVVFHGAFAVIAHPVKIEATHNCEGHTKLAMAEQSREIAHGSHQHSQSAAPATDEHGGHHGKIKDANTCCSAVSAAVLPRTQAGSIAGISTARLRAVLAVTGEGHAPPTPSKPPRPAYQS